MAMHIDLPSSEDLRVFVAVARLAGFTRAASQLQLPRSTVSTAIKRLEATLGARLLQRTTRRVVLTTEGQDLLVRSERLLEDFEDLAGAFRQPQATLRGRLRVDVPIGMATGVVMEALPDFLARHPELELDFLSTDRRVDVVSEGLDCVVRGGPVIDESMACRPLGALPMVNVVSAGYIARYGCPESLSDLASHWLINYESNPVDADAGFEYEAEAAQHCRPVPHRITVNNSAAYKSACRAGFGIAQIPRISAAPDIAAGSLVEILPHHRPQAMALNLLYPHRRNVPQRVRLFGDWLAEVMRESIPGL